MQRKSAPTKRTIEGDVTSCFVISRPAVRVREVAQRSLCAEDQGNPQVPHRTSHRETSYVDIRKAMSRVCEEAGIDPGLRRHALRHSFGTALAEAGLTDAQIAAWLGHASPATAARYTHLTAPTMRRDAARVGAALRVGGAS